MPPPKTPASIGGCVSSTTNEGCTKAYDKDSSKMWDVTSPSWIMILLDYPTTLNIIKLTFGDVPCTQFDIELEIDGFIVKPTELKLDISNYILKQNQIKTSPEGNEVEITFMTKEKVTGVKLNFVLPVTCQVQEISLSYSTVVQEPWSMDSMPGKRMLAD